MKPFYSPFVDKKGNIIPLSKLRFSHVLQLKEHEIEEGYQVEYKSRWDDNFLKKHLCQTIASFANSEGGWLFVGIEDNTANYIGIEKLRADYNQIISQKLVSVSPMPKFESRFVKDPKNSRKGILVVYIYEGTDPPYVCNGTVYLRSGSSKIPVRSGRIEIDNLVQKAEKFDKQHKAFCTNNLIGKDAQFPVCSIYLYNPYANIDINQISSRLRTMKNELNETGLWQRINYSLDSILCYGSDVVSKEAITTVAEFFADGNVKLFCPLFVLPRDLYQGWAEFIKERSPNIDVGEMLVTDGYITYASMLRQLINAFEYLKKSNYHINDYYISFEYKNIGKSVLFFRQNLQTTEDIGQYIQTINCNNFYVCPKSEISTLPTHFIHDVPIDEVGNNAIQILEANFAFLFGIDPIELTRKIEESGPLYKEKLFSSHYHYKS